ncbi:palmitoyl-(protein) hydrolase [Spizellomyces punctatus DAOM BR117]|uniref:Acyl-protein thioesterase 1 n=1 Tax=Spizellomyces punctatus (strain DAOM BR117) TaxID=645134 RepID=A0A0L0HFN4_SPIPD|nr:palmitoyl-(protein) hydrolase [Spizellomyces punctatus DAOM BR117]KNC99734.1 hypothetical protein SPPG_05114 [Spizellomyces punctatus DAOM BR117]|eukprot:XP_016607774.1 hypothetical protein SPPG_05114 [Spizellomyces punctatus DAOM BR117]
MSTAAALKYLVVPAKSKHTATVFFLHGLGDSGNGWAPVAKMLQPLLPHVKWVLPHAPQKPVSINFGMAMPAWYDIHHLGPGGREDEAGVMDSVSKITELINDEIRSGISADRIVLGGFSQGAAVSIVYSLTSNTRLAGFTCLSGYLPLTTNIDKLTNSTNKGTPMLMCHGDADEVVAYQWGKMTYDKLKELDRKVEFKTYRGMGHSSSNDEVKDVAEFLKELLP